MEISSKIIENHGLTLKEYNKIQKFLQRDPNLLELEFFSYVE